MIAVYGLSMLTIFLEISRLYYIFDLLGIQILFSQLGFVFCSTILISIITLIPGSVGIHENTQAEIIESLDFFSNSILIKHAILLDRFLAYYFIVLLGIPIIFFNNSLIKNKSNNL